MAHGTQFFGNLPGYRWPLDSHGGEDLESSPGKWSQVDITISGPALPDYTHASHVMTFLEKIPVTLFQPNGLIASAGFFYFCFTFVFRRHR